MWKSHFLDWVPFASAVAGKPQSGIPLPVRLVELVVVGCVSAYGTLTGLEYKVAGVQSALAAHEKMNAEYRDRVAKEKAVDDQKWDARIKRMEDCFIARQCGVGK